MKKLLYLLLLAPFALLTSCDKDEVTPFDMTLTLAGVSQADNNFYAVQGDEIAINNLEVASAGDKTVVSNVLFYVDGYPLFPNPWNLEGPLSFSTANLKPGNHTINASGYLLQVNQSLKTFAVNYPLVIVDSEESLPAGAPEIGTYSMTINFTNN